MKLFVSCCCRPVTGSVYEAVALIVSPRKRNAEVLPGGLAILSPTIMDDWPVGFITEPSVCAKRDQLNKFLEDQMQVLDYSNNLPQTVVRLALDTQGKLAQQMEAIL